MMIRFALLAATFLATVALPATTQAEPPPLTKATTTSPALKLAWHSYHQALDEMRVMLENTQRFRDNPRDRAKAYHTLMEMQAMAYNFIIQPRMTHPRIFRNMGWATNISTLGQNGPDFDYRNLFVDGAQTYRITGRTGATKLNLIQVFNGVFGEPGVKTIGNYDLADMKVGRDGRFEIILGGSKRAGNWIPLDPAIGYQYVFFRRAITDWNDDIGELKIERNSDVPAGHYDADEFDETAMAKRIVRAEQFIRYLNDIFTVQLHDGYIKGAGGKYNTMNLRPGVEDSEVGSPSSNYAQAVFNLADDEALVIEMPKAPQGVYWSFQLGDVWSRSLDFHERQSSLNMDQAKVRKDGSLQLVVSKSDPGVANWLDTVGRDQGTVVMRNYRSKTAPVPTARVVKLADLARELPGDTVWVTPAQRAAALAHRRAGYIKVYGE